jgi:predicted ATPase
VIAHRLLATALLHTGDIADARAHYDQAIALYDPVEHRPLAVRFGQDVRMTILSFRSLASWCLGYPEAALLDADYAVKEVRGISQAASLMYALFRAVFAHALCGNYATAKALCDELVDLSDEKGASFWKALAMSNRGCLLALTGDAADAVHMITSALSTYHSTGATVFTPWYLSTLAGAHAKLGQFDDAWRCIDEAMTAVEATKETWCDAELNCTAGKIALMVPDPGATKAEAYFQRALAIARQQQAKSWELRASMSLARLWRDQGKPQQARELLAPIYGWLTEGFDTRDLKEAKALLNELAA